MHSPTVRCSSIAALHDNASTCCEPSRSATSHARSISRCSSQLTPALSSLPHVCSCISVLRCSQCVALHGAYCSAAVYAAAAAVNHARCALAALMVNLALPVLACAAPVAAALLCAGLRCMAALQRWLHSAAAMHSQ
ncbi:hypothetical protein KOW79_013512 [Hemibagrus wyckioides]|uniref:Uncharacterized protein n=1 Tax=Hemibagrus wyckioides TaxID=337641 RepID=A0A9D3SH89_9TELE|nr:hypothetical protein KOW79_013512 [Hemibagrus wyckioides]